MVNNIISDDIIGRNKVFRAIVDGQPIPDPSLPESFRVLTRELRALGIYVEFSDTNWTRIKAPP